MYDAKREQGHIRLYDAGRDPYSPERLERLGELRQALADGELVLHYQPKISVAGGQVTASRRSSAGSIRGTGCSPRRSSSRWPSAPA